jgi:hypothetical protein
MRIDDLPFIDEHLADIAASADDTWTELVESVDASFLRSAAKRFARVVGCEQTAPSGPRPLAAGSTIPGFRVETAVPGKELVLAGRHRFAAYALSFRLEARGPQRTRLYAETRASFPGVRGGFYRLLVITFGGHTVAVRRLLAGVKRRTETSARAGA